MIQGKSHHAESRAETRKASAAQNRIQGKTTAEPIAPSAPIRRFSRESLQLEFLQRLATAAACFQCRKSTEAALPSTSPDIIQQHGGPPWTT
jgi:hypothetical protein